ncbi:alpha/beta hydrolase [Streptomyces sp. NBC_00435]|uniref:alpha/beta fold hydrolase n=1 Tax=Streptomyces sp. NBC_00435 TaxID=2903649 RepID=UPI002E1A6F6C
MGVGAVGLVLGALLTGPVSPAAPAGTDGGRQVVLADGREVYLDCRGRGSPTVVLESGIHDSSDTWTQTQAEPPASAEPAVLPGLARTTRVCAYDRPGTIRYTAEPTLTARSTPVPMPRTLPGLVTDLDELLTTAGEKGPYLLVGHSFGGMITRLYAQTHPGETAGLVFVDAFGPPIRKETGSHWPAYARLVNRPGVALENEPGFETIDIDGAIDAVERAPRLPAVPMAVMSKTAPFATAPGTPPALMAAVEAAWPRVQDSLVALAPRTPHILATGSDHYIQLREPDLTIATIGLLADRIRGARPAHGAVPGAASPVAGSRTVIGAPAAPVP